MNRAELIDSLDRFRSELAEAEARAKAALSEADALRKIVDGIEGLVAGSPVQLAMADGETKVSIPAAANGAAGVTPRGREAVRRIFIETGRPWKRAEMASEVVRRGWIDPAAKTPAAAVGRALERLCLAGEVEQLGGGMYRYIGDRSVPDPNDMEPG